MRPLHRPLTVLVAVSLAIGGLAACSKDDDEKASPSTTTSTALAAPPVIAVQISAIDPNGTQPPDDATVAAIRSTLETWLAAAVVGPLYTGQPAGDLSPVFTTAALERLGADPAARSTLVAEGLPPTNRSIEAERANVALSTVAGPDGAVAVVNAALDILVHAVGPTIDVEVNHYGDLVLVQEADVWKIDAFNVTVRQDTTA